MKITLQISTNDFRKISEGYGGFTFNVEETYKSDERLRGMRVSDNNLYINKKTLSKSRDKKQKELQESPVSDFMIETIKTNRRSYKILKIEPDDPRI